jgi:hypothetical protein
MQRVKPTVVSSAGGSIIYLPLLIREFHSESIVYIFNPRLNQFFPVVLILKKKKLLMRSACGVCVCVSTVSVHLSLYLPPFPVIPWDYWGLWDCLLSVHPFQYSSAPNSWSLRDYLLSMYVTLIVDRKLMRSSWCILLCLPSMSFCSLCGTCSIEGK